MQDLSTVIATKRAIPKGQQIREVCERGPCIAQTHHCIETSLAFLQGFDRSARAMPSGADDGFTLEEGVKALGYGPFQRRLLLLTASTQLADAMELMLLPFLTHGKLLIHVCTIESTLLSMTIACSTRGESVRTA